MIEFFNAKRKLLGTVRVEDEEVIADPSVQSIVESYKARNNGSFEGFEESYSAWSNGYIYSRVVESKAEESTEEDAIEELKDAIEDDEESTEEDAIEELRETVEDTGLNENTEEENIVASVESISDLLSEGQDLLKFSRNNGKVFITYKTDGSFPKYIDSQGKSREISEKEFLKYYNKGMNVACADIVNTSVKIDKNPERVSLSVPRSTASKIDYVRASILSKLGDG